MTTTEAVSEIRARLAKHAEEPAIPDTLIVYAQRVREYPILARLVTALMESQALLGITEQAFVDAAKEFLEME